MGNLLEEIKSSASKWIKTKSPLCSSFAWQAGYGAFSCGQSQLPALINYIEKQPEHHGTKSYEAELREILNAYGVDHDVQLWLGKNDAAKGAYVNYIYLMKKDGKESKIVQ